MWTTCVSFPSFDFSIKFRANFVWGKNYRGARIDKDSVNWIKYIVGAIRVNEDGKESKEGPPAILADVRKNKGVGERKKQHPGNQEAETSLFGKMGSKMLTPARNAIKKKVTFGQEKLKEEGDSTREIKVGHDLKNLERWPISTIRRKQRRISVWS